MLAFHGARHGADPDLSRRISASLGLMAGVEARTWVADRAILSFLPPVATLPPRAQRARHRWPAFSPARAPSGRMVLFHGWLDNAADVADELRVDPADPATLYGAAVDAWGGEADLRLIGNYAAMIHCPGSVEVRLSRSPLRAPPLHYFTTEDSIGAASVPRVLEAMGLARRLNRRKLIDALYFNQTEDEGFLEGTCRVGLGSIVHLTPGRSRVSRFYDPLSYYRRTPRSKIEDYVEEVDRLLTEAAKVATAGARDPAMQLSGGLDSSNIAARVLRVLPAQQRLKTLTYVPHPGMTQKPIIWRTFDERPAVEAFAAMHTRIDPHFVDNANTEFDHIFEQEFLASGSGQPHAGVQFRYHGIWAKARELGCDRVLAGDSAETAFSAYGEWSYPEDFRRLHWLRMVRNLQNDRLDSRSLFRKVISRAIIPNLPDPLWRMWKKARGFAHEPFNLSIAALTPMALRDYDVIERARAAGVSYERDSYGTRRQLLVDNFARGDCEGSDRILALEQIYEVSSRDVPAHRPLMEFCLGLPSDVFLRDGSERWLARELGRGLMPEAQRTSLNLGVQYADWHARLTPRIDDIRQDLARARAMPELDFIDFDALEHTLDTWPEESTLTSGTYFACAFTVPRVVAVIRYVQFMTGRNTSGGTSLS